MQRATCTFYFACCIGLYLATLTDVHTYDALSYILDVDRKPWRELFHPHHLAYGPLGALIRGAATAFGWVGSAEKLLQLANALAGAAGVALFAGVVARATRRAWAGALGALLLGSSYAFWYYAVEVEVYTIAALFLVLALGFMLELVRAPSRQLAFALGAVHGLAVLFHQTNVLLSVPALVALVLGSRGTWGRGGLLRLVVGYAAPLALIVGGAYLWVGIGVSGFRSVGELMRWAAGYATTGFWGGPVDGDKLLLLGQGLAESVAQPGGASVGTVLLGVLVLRWRRLAMAPQGVLAMCASWLAVYGAFFLWWEPDNIEFWIASMPPFYLLVALAVAERNDDRRAAGGSTASSFARVLALVVFACGVAMLGLNLASIAQRGDAGRDLQRVAAAEVAAVSAPGDLILAEDGLPELYLPFYANRPNVFSLSQAMAAAGDWDAACALIRSRIEEAQAGGYAVLIAEAARRPMPAPPDEPPTPAQRFGLSADTVAACYAPFEVALQPIRTTPGLPAYSALPSAQSLADGPGWDFKLGRWGWRASNTEPTPNASGWALQPGRDPFIQSPPVQIETARFSAIELRLGTSTTARDAQLFFLDSAGRADEARSIRWELEPGSEPTTYTLRLRDAPGWEGLIGGLRLDPVGVGDGGVVIVETIRLLR
jgi:hypothetical protein